MAVSTKLQARVVQTVINTLTSVVIPTLVVPDKRQVFQIEAVRVTPDVSSMGAGDVSELVYSLQLFSAGSAIVAVDNPKLIAQGSFYCNGVSDAFYGHSDNGRIGMYSLPFAIQVPESSLLFLINTFGSPAAKFAGALVEVYGSYVSLSEVDYLKLTCGV
jgi:hypothetical protein